MSTGGLPWFKSSYSGGDGGECLEVALSWRKSSHCHAHSGECVEVAACPGTVHVRDSKDTTGPQFALSPEAWTAFLGHAVRG